MIRLAAFLFLAATAASAQQPTPLAGAWIVDLRPTPQAPAYLKPMTLTVAPDGKLTLSFYEHPIENGRAIATDGRQCFAFRTSDASGPYQTSGCLKGKAIEGQTWSEGRGFVLVWTARRSR